MGHCILLKSTNKKNGKYLNVLKIASKRHYRFGEFQLIWFKFKDIFPELFSSREHGQLKYPFDAPIYSQSTIINSANSTFLLYIISEIQIVLIQCFACPWQSQITRVIPTDNKNECTSLHYKVHQRRYLRKKELYASKIDLFSEDSNEKKSTTRIDS